jgi:hypothetical protein
MTRNIFLIGVGIVSTAIIGAAMIIKSSMPPPMRQPMHVIAESQKCFDTRQLVAREKASLSMSADLEAYEKMNPEEQVEKRRSLGEKLRVLNEMLEDDCK